MKKTFRSHNSTLRRSYLKHKTPLHRCTPLHCDTPLKRYTQINKVSTRQSHINSQWEKTVMICKVRCEGTCEIHGPDCVNNYGLTPHHIISRARGGSHLPSNCIIGCVECHNHAKYAEGTPLSVYEALELVERLNREHGIRE